MLPVHFLTDNHPLRGEDAVAALITVEDGRYLMQLRDDIPRIFYPGHWGCFGGAVSPGEDEIEALQRELAEELEMRHAGAAVNSSTSTSISASSARRNATGPITRSRSTAARSAVSFCTRAPRCGYLRRTNVRAFQHCAL